MSSDYRRKTELKDYEFYLAQSRSVLLKTRDFTIRPVDKREHFIKRCVGVPGDQIEIIDGVLQVNGTQAEVPGEMQYNYLVEMKQPFVKSESSMMNLKETYGINFQDVIQLDHKVMLFPLTNDAFKRMSNDPMVARVQRLTHYKDKMSVFTKRGITAQFDAKYVEKLNAIGNYNPDLNIFPNDPNYHWTEDNFGPLTIPKKGETVELTAANLPLYHRIISVYEGNDLVVKDGTILINGSEATSYTFQMDYYWLMGDNRHNSADSRFWGFVPEDHVVGKASMVWMSLDPELGWTDGKIRWNRFFSFVD
jgi:signal peptidase I